MPVTVRGTDILFNDGTTQSTAGGSVNTTSVLNATAGASTGAVGSYALCYLNNQSATNEPGSTRAGSQLQYASATGFFRVGGPAGTWRCMGRAIQNGYETAGQGVTLWLRIS